MKKVQGLHIRQFLFVSLLAILFAACKKDDTPPVRTPVAGFMAFNLAPDQNAVVFSLSGNNVSNTPLAYNNYTGNYLPIYIGSRELSAFAFGTNNTLATATGNFADSMYYSAFLIGANGNYRNVIVQDHLDTLRASAGKAYVRYINAVADSAAVPEVVLSVGGETSTTENAAYGDVSSFRQVGAGQLTATISGGTGIAATRTITLEENKIYTLLFSGVPAAADSTQAVQIKFIQNGTIVP
jgi:Domain of unknown function (DUF4397)